MTYVYIYIYIYMYAHVHLQVFNERLVEMSFTKMDSMELEDRGAAETRISKLMCIYIYIYKEREREG